MTGQARTLCMVHGNIDTESAIGSQALFGVQVALEAGWQVTAVARSVDPSIRGEVRTVPYRKPPRLHLAQWAAARPAIGWFLRHHAFDVVHVHEPQLASLADVFQVHFLSVGNQTPATHRGVALTPKQRIQAAQHRVIRRLEDRYLRQISPATDIVLCSDLLASQFRDAYGSVGRQRVQHYPSWAAVEVNEASRAAARAHYGVPERAPLLGYLGGLDVRKGWRPLLDAVEHLPDVHLLFGGTGTDGFRSDDNRIHPIGRVEDLGRFFAAIDLLVVPSLYDPFAVVVTEAAAFGVPSIVTPTVGAGALLERHRAGHVWDPATPLEGVVKPALAALEELRAGAGRLRESVDRSAVAASWRALYDDAAVRPSPTRSRFR